MKTIALLGVASLLSGCFFVYIPGSVIGAATDAISGADGEHCVGAAEKVGGRITIPAVGTGTIKSLSGTSSRCTDPRFPIRARLEF